MIASKEACLPLLRCPRTGQPLMFRDDGSAASSDGSMVYPVAGGLPVLIDFGESVVERGDVIGSATESVVTRPRYEGMRLRLKRLVSPVKQATMRNIQDFIAAVKTASPRPIVLVIGGGTVGQGMDALYKDPAIRVVAFDLYRSPNAHFIADAHAIPLADGSVHGVVVQAVLEHVLQPARVVDEIWRVLGRDGLVYAETPFLQQVHEGAYDFTRFTESGHRYLFRKFELLASGVSGGAGQQLLWSLDYFARSLFRSRLAGKAVKLAFFWLRFFDRIIPSSYASDAASGVYFFGRKSATELSPREIVQFYRGAQKAG